MNKDNYSIAAHPFSIKCGIPL